MQGRKPKPTALKQLEGNPGKRPLNSSEPKPGGVPDCPSHLDRIAKSEWKRVSQELIAVGLLTSVDRAILAAYCESWSRWVQATKLLRQQEVEKGRSMLVIATQNGNAIQNPLIGIINTASEQIRKLATELGLSPSARSRLHVEPASAEDPFAAFMRDIGADAPDTDTHDDQAGEIHPRRADRQASGVEVGQVSD